MVADQHVTGVEMMDGEIVSASKEVVLSSGAVGSPRLLMLSRLWRTGRPLHARYRYFARPA